MIHPGTDDTALLKSQEAACGTGPADIRDDVEQAILDIWQRYLGGRQIGVKDDYFEIGGDSLKAVLVIGECSEHFGIDLPLSVLFERRTVERLADAVRESVRGELPSRIVPLREREGGGDAGVVPSLLLIHPVGGTVFCYRDLVARLTGDAPVYGIQAAGLRAGEGLPGSIEEMAEDYLQAAVTAVGNGPVHLAGWSFGGLVAFEMARRLTAAGRPAVSLMLIDTPSGLGFLNQDDGDATLRAVSGALGVDLDTLAAAAGSGPRPTIATIAAAIAASQPGNAAFSEEQIERMVRLIRNARELRRRYRPPRIPGGLTLLRALDESDSRDEDFDWDSFADGPVDVVALPATHDSIVRPPHVDVIASILSRRLAGDLG